LFKKSLAILAYTTLSLLILTQAAFSSSTTSFHSLSLGWDAVPESDIQGYKIHIGGASGEYTMTFTTEGTVAEVPGLEFGKTYYFAVSAIGSAGVESVLSTELAVTIAPPPLPAGTSVGPDGSGGISLKWTFPVSDLDSSPEFIIQSSPDLVNWSFYDTVSAEEAVGVNGGFKQFSRPVEPGEGSMFFRLTAKNFMGTATAP
jgi:hypothetical protein